MVAKKCAHAQELNPCNVHLLSVASVDADRSENSMLDRRVLIFQKGRRSEEVFNWDTLVFSLGRGVVFFI